MSELSFAKQFLTALDSRPVKLSSDHVADPRTFTFQSPPILPRMPHPKRKRSAANTTSTSTAPSVTVHLKSLKGASQSLRLASQPLSTSVHELKREYAAQRGVPLDRVKLLHNRKPCADSKTLRDLLPDEQLQQLAPEAEAEFSVMVMGGGGAAAAPAAAAAAAAPAAAGGAATPPAEAPLPVNEAGEVQSGEAPVAQGKAALRTEEFWEDLSGFLVQRLRDEGEGRRLAGVFRGACEKGG